MARSQGSLAEARFEKVTRGVAKRPSCRPQPFDSLRSLMAFSQKDNKVQRVSPNL